MPPALQQGIGFLQQLGALPIAYRVRMQGKSLCQLFQPFSGVKVRVEALPSSFRWLFGQRCDTLPQSAGSAKRHLLQAHRP
jgi:hypothetical protein